MKRLGEAETNDERAAETAITKNPHWHGRSATYTPLCADVVSPVHRGVESAVWLVEIEGKTPHVLKVMREDMRPYFDVQAAIAGAKLAASADVGPPVLWADVVSGAIALSLLGEGWRTATLADLNDQDALEKIVTSVKALHGEGTLERRFNVFERVRTLLADAKAEGVSLPADGWFLVEAVADIEEAVTASGADSAPCRNDGVSSNIMLGEGVRLLDYDNAGMNDPIYDLAVLLTEAFAFDSEMAQAVETFCGRFDQVIVDRVVAYGVADDLMWALWAALAAKRSLRTHVEFAKYSEWRFLRCRMAVGDPRFEERLRKL